MNGQTGRFGSVKPGNPSKVAPVCLILGATEKTILGQGKNKVQAF